MSQPTPPPEALTVQRLLDGARLNFALAAALELHLFEHLAAAPATAAELAARAGVSERGAQALLDAFVALALVQVAEGRYRLGSGAAEVLTPRGAFYVGDEHGRLLRAALRWTSRLTETVRGGHPGVAIDDPALLEFWTLLTPMIARYGRPVAAAAIEKLGLRDGSPSLLDVGGGMALYSLALLTANPRARATQADWPHINRQARAAVEQAGVADRFDTLDGDFRQIDFGEGRYDVTVASNIVHQESPDSNRSLFARLHRALKPGGRLLVSEFVVDDGRAGPPPSLLFNLNMLGMTEAGKSYERRELTALITAAGFAPPSFTPVGPASTLVIANR